eukprot:1014890-Prymnesium_polylepis.1
MGDAPGVSRAFSMLPETEPFGEISCPDTLLAAEENSAQTFSNPAWLRGARGLVLTFTHRSRVPR